MYHVYILECEDGTLYTGITTDVDRRFREHQEKKGGHYTRAREVIRIAYTEESANRSSATKREIEIKRMSKPEKLLLIHANL